MAIDKSENSKISLKIGVERTLISSVLNIDVQSWFALIWCKFCVISLTCNVKLGCTMSSIYKVQNFA